MAIGDFNTIPSPNEKTCGLSDGRRCPYFGDFVDLANLHDLGFRDLLLLGTGVLALPRGRPFGFLAGWAEHPDFDNFMKDQWDFQGNMSASLDKITGNLKD
ncbi:hypothetical protein PVK06_026261 [Gossypium arboreum]|uniref:Endonuclease/exonuclease/phosphatase domain-containing protein n=1 Tax=Gossypium arboreum TaxID=29729 RepID=A0ABR0NYF8_GOSAR|nr:hypothetical protein PVK06_026261 [Gossypium arboreum]